MQAGATAVDDAGEEQEHSRRDLLQLNPGAEIISPEVRRDRAQRCRLTRGDWCGRYERTPAVPATAPPRGSKLCVRGCNNVGVCNYDSGICDCPAGWTGDDCTTPLRRACSHRYRDSVDNSSTPWSSIDADGRDKNWTEPGWTASRCGGICDDEIAACFCDNPDFGRVAPPPGSPQGTPPLRRGRQLGDHCDPKETWDGKKVPWGNTPYEKIYGKNGWCNATHPAHHCGCMLDGYYGNECDQLHEMYCANQCSGHGACYLGFCKCYPGWYGHDCARKQAGLELESSDAAPGGASPWLATVAAESPAALVPSAGATRKRPFVYVYDLPAEFHSRMLQYRVLKRACVHRLFRDNNRTQTMPTNLYGVETLIHELMLQSEHRTFDPEEADFFYVPIMTTCLIFPVFAWTDSPWYNGPMHLRVLQASNFLLKAKRWLQENLPYWNRKQGRDHIWLAVHDEGACWMPSEIYNTSIMLTHWGRMDLEHVSNTAYGWDNYTGYDKYLTSPVWEPGDWREKHKGHPCYSPSKDLVIPSIKFAEHYRFSPILGAPQPARDILCFFKGDVGLQRLSHYSRGIRQTLHGLAKKNNWAAKHKILIGTASEEHMKGLYSTQLASSQFCLVLPGDGWSGRAEDAVLHGCIPVVIMDNVHAVFESILDWDTFSVRVRETSLEHLPHILEAIPDDVRDRMRRRLMRVWHRFAWTSGPFMRKEVESVINDWPQNRQLLELAPQGGGGGAAGGGGGGEGRPGGQDSKVMRAARTRRQLFTDDAFATVMQWLAGRMAP